MLKWTAFVGIGAASIMAAGTVAQASVLRDQEQIKQLVATEIAGGSEQNIEKTMSVYCNTPDVVLFESGPYVMRGYDNLKAAWAAYFKAFKKAEGSLIDLNVGTSGNLAYAFSRQQWKFTAPDGSVRQDEHRVTNVYRRVAGKWCMFHENDSVPSKIVEIDEKAPKATKEAE